MCSLNDVDGVCENFISPEKLTLSGNTKCRSCSNQARVVLRKKDVYCKDCFLATETHKFRASLGKSKMMKPKDKVLLAFSGSQSSLALLHLLDCGVKEESHKKLMFEVVVLYIDEGVILNKDIKERQEIFNNIRKTVADYDFSLYVTTLSKYFNDSPDINSSLVVNTQNDSELVNLFENVADMSSKEDLLYLLRQKLLLSAAQQLNCNKIFTAEVGNDLAVKLLASFSLGRGDQASFETGFCDHRHTSIKVLRPLRDFTRKEVVFYNKFHHLEGINIPSLTTKSPSNISIQKLTEKFITDLQTEFPSTVYTIFRTGEKLGVNSENEESNSKICLLCKDKIRNNSSRINYTAVQAANFSRNVSSKKSNSCKISENSSCCGSCSGSSGKKIGITEIELENFLCYGCTQIVRDMKNIDCLPKDLLRSAIEKRDFEAMKEQISEFLIEPP